MSIHDFKGREMLAGKWQDNRKTRDVGKTRKLDAMSIS